MATVTESAREEVRDFIWEIKKFDVVRQTAENLRRQKLDFENGDSISSVKQWSMSLDLIKENATSEGGREEVENKLATITTTKKFIVLVCGLSDPGQIECLEANKQEPRVFADLHVKILKTDGSPFFETRVKEFEVIPEIDVFCNIMEQRQNVEGVLDEHGSLLIYLQVRMYVNPATAVKKYFKVHMFKNKEALADNIRRYRTRQEGDLLILAKNNTVFDAHKSVLAGGSIIFAARFKRDSYETEDINGYIKMTDLSPLAVEVILHFLYTGELQDAGQDEALFTHLIYGADRYAVNGLLEVYDKLLVNVCTSLNAERLLEIARRHGLEKSKNHIGTFIKNRNI